MHEGKRWWGWGGICVLLPLYKQAGSCPNQSVRAVLCVLPIYIGT